MNKTSWLKPRRSGRCFTRAGASILLVAIQVEESHAAFEYQLNGAASITYTDNLTNAPDEQPEVGAGPQGSPNALRREPGLLYTVSPGAMISLVEPRGQLSLAYSHPITFASSDVVPSTSSDAFIGTGTYELTPIDDISLSASLTRSSFTALLFNNQAATTISGVSNTGTQEIFRFHVGQVWARQWTESVRSQQSASFGSQLELEETDLPNTRVATGSAGFFIDHRCGTFGFSVTQSATENPVGERDWTHIVAALASWARPLDPLTAMMLTIGTSKTLTDSPFQLIGGVNVTQNREFVTWSAGVNRSQSADLQTGRVFTTDSLLAAFAANPFETAPVGFNASVTGSHLDSALGAGYTLQASATISYAHRYFFSSLNYSFLRQIGDDDGPTAIPTLTRNAVMLTIGSAFPPQ